MRVNVVTNYNGRGLERDADVISALVERAGHQVQPVQYDREVTGRPAELNVCLEVAPDWAFALAPRSWYLPNPEWLEEREAARILPRCERVLCKTRDALRLLALRTDRAELVGFASRDRMDAAMPRERRFLCVCGKSIAKAADVAIAAWMRYRPAASLTVVGALHAHHPPVPGVIFAGHLSDEALRHEQNAALFHLAPSWYEGWGHSIHEGLSCGAIVMVPDAPPMNEWGGCPRSLRIRTTERREQRSAVTCRVTPDAIYAAAEACARMTADEVADARTRARRQFEEERADFEARMLSLLSAA